VVSRALVFSPVPRPGAVDFSEPGMRSQARLPCWTDSTPSVREFEAGEDVALCR
jgi:hypothetical protein